MHTVTITLFDGSAYSRTDTPERLRNWARQYKVYLKTRRGYEPGIQDITVYGAEVVMVEVLPDSS
jgi:hypothetical protein